MRYYDKKENKVSRWHKSKIKWFQEKTGLSDYQMMWSSFAKGLIIGLLIL